MVQTKIPAWKNIRITKEIVVCEIIRNDWTKYPGSQEEQAKDIVDDCFLPKNGD